MRVHRDRSLLRLLLLTALCSCALACLSGTSEAPTEEGARVESYRVRGEFLGSRFEGRAMRVAHEEIPGFMKAMTMDLPLENRELTRDLSPGAKIEFTIEERESGLVVTRIERLSDKTELNLELTDQESREEYLQ